MQRISREHWTCLLTRDAEPICEIAPGQPVLFETLDALGGRVKTHADALATVVPRELGNPATGPVYVRGAEPGDTLAVHIEAIELGAFGFGRVKRGGVIFDELNPPAANLTPIHDGMVQFNERLRFPVRPMVGVIAVAPAGDPVANFYPGPHGGNMDVNATCIGATVYLPVSAPGALLAIGDVHASMGDGELNGGGLDIDAEVTVTVEVLHGLGWRWPVIQTPSAWCAVANAPTLEAAVRQATHDMVNILARALQMSREEAFILIGAAGDMRIGQAAALGMDCTVYLQVSKTILPSALG